MEGPTKHHFWKRLYGCITSAAEEKKYLLNFDDGSEKEYCLAIL
jgi:hypothetical protein